jgi:hypothetical protein
MWTHIAMEISRSAGPKVWESWKVGDRVQHIGTKEWATIEKIVPQTDGTCEMLLVRDPDAFSTSKASWGSYHVRDHQTAEQFKVEGVRKWR